MSKFVIFASPRTGSTSLAKVLAESPDVNMAIEPFHEKYTEWHPNEPNYLSMVKDVQTMNHAVDMIFDKHTAIKVLGYQLEPEIYFELLRREELKILHLKRRSLWDSAISTAVAHQVGEWHKQGDQSVYENLKPIDPKEIEEWIDYARDLNEEYGNFLKQNREGEYLEIFYEDLYSDDFNENKKKLKIICEFLGIELPRDEAIRKHMMPSIAKINYEDVYKKIPNYEELKRLLKK